ncbi:hypothetical protein TrVE_jg8388 [Triparma verrucosa]|uniref:Transcription initiation factor TFIID subunit 8 n=1 Tax=Triparma verrucosa TaxID=1606542 RepID=A0A9W7F9S6_9STRA|nr:hypothetical protein TrVE_jg8388 [Triparma verrucosa]
MSSSSLPTESQRVKDALRAAGLDPALQSDEVLTALSEHSRRFASSLFLLSCTLSLHSSPQTPTNTLIKKLTSRDLHLSYTLKTSSTLPPTSSRLLDLSRSINLRPLPSLPLDSYGVSLPRVQSYDNSSGSLLKRKYRLYPTTNSSYEGNTVKDGEDPLRTEEVKEVDGKVKKSVKKVKYTVKNTLDI